MAKTCTKIHVVCSDTGPQEFLKDIVVFIGSLGGSYSPNQIAAMLFPDSLKIARYQIQGFIPAGLFKFSVFPDQGVLQQLWALDKIHPETPLHAEMPAVFSTPFFNPAHSDNFAILGTQFNLATAAAMRTGGTDPVQFPSPGLKAGQLFCKGPGGTSLQAGTARGALGGSQRVIDPGVDHQFRSPAGKIQDIAAGDFAAGAHAATA